MIEVLVDNIYVRFGGQFFRQMVGIPMGTNCAPLLADLFFYCYENEFLDKLIKEGKRKLARKFNLSYRYIDDFISSNNKRFKEFISDIYPKELTISETTEFTSIACCLNLLFIPDKSNNIMTKLYDKREGQYNSRSQDPRNLDPENLDQRNLDPKNLDPRNLDPRNLDPRNLDTRKLHGFDQIT